MTGQRIGYIRVSSVDQNTDRQLEAIKVDRVFTDKASGKDTKRPALEEMVRFVRQGDTVVVHSFDRLARNMFDLRTLVTSLTDRGIKVEFVKEALTFTGKDSPMATLMMNLLGSIAEFERALIRERQLEGIAIAKRKGVYKGRKPALTPERVKELKSRVDAGEKKAKVAREFGITRETLYQYLRA
jgi:DNA invertase Pin-like site-specific DNA recombinase